MEQLNIKQSQFVLEYLIDRNATQAAIRAKYSHKTAGSIGHELLKKPEIQLAIYNEVIEQGKRTKIDADWVLKRNAEMLEADISDIIDDMGRYLPIKKWPKIWRQMLAGMDVQELYAGTGRNREQIGEVCKIKFIDRLKALEMIGKHTNVQAFKDKIDVNLNGTVNHQVLTAEQYKKTRDEMIKDDDI